jgi:hypothetical protein
LRAPITPVASTSLGRNHCPTLEILAEIRAIEQEILPGIEEFDGVLR